jgi:hypothetical protein
MTSHEHFRQMDIGVTTFILSMIAVEQTLINAFVNRSYFLSNNSIKVPDLHYCGIYDKNLLTNDSSTSFENFLFNRSSAKSYSRTQLSFTYYKPNNVSCFHIYHGCFTYEAAIFYITSMLITRCD